MNTLNHQNLIPTFITLCKNLFSDGTSAKDCSNLLQPFYEYLSAFETSQNKIVSDAPSYIISSQIISYSVASDVLSHYYEFLNKNGIKKSASIQKFSLRFWIEGSSPENDDLIINEIKPIKFDIKSRQKIINNFILNNKKTDKMLTFLISYWGVEFFIKEYIETIKYFEKKDLDIKLLEFLIKKDSQKFIYNNINSISNKDIRNTIRQVYQMVQLDKTLPIQTKINQQNKI